MPVNLANFTRPNSASIFKFDPLNPVDVSRVTTLLLTNVVVPVPGRVRLDTTTDWTASTRNRIARSPVERVVTTTIRRDPRDVTITGTLSATPLGVLGSLFGSFGSIVRRDLREIDKLRAIVESGEPCAVVTPDGKVYPSMGCEILDEQHGGGNRVRVSLRFSEIRIVSPLSVALDSILPGASSTQAVGAASTPAPAPTQVTPVSPFGV